MAGEEEADDSVELLSVAGDLATLAVLNAATTLAAADAVPAVPLGLVATWADFTGERVGDVAVARPRGEDSGDCDGEMPLVEFFLVGDATRPQAGLAGPFEGLRGGDTGGWASGTAAAATAASPTVAVGASAATIGAVELLLASLCEVMSSAGACDEGGARSPKGEPRASVAASPVFAPCARCVEGDG